MRGNDDAARVGYNMRLGDYAEDRRVSIRAHAALHLHRPSLKIVMHDNVVPFRLVSSIYMVMIVVVIHP